MVFCPIPFRDYEDYTIKSPQPLTHNVMHYLVHLNGAEHRSVSNFNTQDDEH